MYLVHYSYGTQAKNKLESSFADYLKEKDRLLISNDRVEDFQQEDKVYRYLILNYQYVQDCRYQRREKFSGPRLVGTAGNLVLPVFIVYDGQHGRYAIDVKYKSAAYPIGGVECFTADYSKTQDYARVAEVLGLDKVLLIFVYNDNLYLYDANDTHGRYSFNNKYGSEAVLYAFNNNHRIR